ncbi:MAG: hypothetical protein GX259_02645 [Bacteroidales bacterium]|nr:hypothetical protein [Bacteroidales bacterium]
MNKFLIYLFYFNFFILALFFQATAQNDLLIQSSRIIPQSYYSNPALTPQCRIHIGLPGLSSLYVGSGHTGFNAKNVISNNISDSVEINTKSLLKSLGKNNYIFTNINEELLSFGFKVKKRHYFNFSLMSHAYFRFSYPKELIKFGLYGNGTLLDEQLDIGNFRANINLYNELALGYTYKLDNTWSFGSRVKFLSGMANINTKRCDISLYTESEFYDITATSDILINTNGLQYLTDTNNKEIDPKEFLNFKNLGVGLDFGAFYKLNSEISLGLSVLDLGFINWKSNPMNIKSKEKGSSFTFDGFTIKEFVNIMKDSSITKNLGDTLISIFNIDSSYNSYKSFLNTQINGSAYYKITKKDQLLYVIRAKFYDGGIHPSFHLSYLRKFGHIWHVMMSYSIENRNFTNLGLGSSLKLGPVQLYLLTDNVLGPVIWNKYTWTTKSKDEFGNQTIKEEKITVPSNWKNMNLHFGINLLFGCKPKKYNPPLLQ